ncbi:hypothetical protein [Muricoccus radiodurans]|uniref:hypothetical protein n=1 Tax=Muricoccus radiodurans TaxID=2231721 RepID=UPI003CEC860E
MLVTSQREVARQLGLSHTALQKAVRSGRIAEEPGGGWDLERVRARLTASADPARRPVPTTPLPGSTSIPTGEGSMPRTGTTFSDARTAHEILKAQERRLRLDERRGKLIDKARALLLVHRLAREERDAILAWPARVAAELAAELGVDPHRLQTLMDSRLRQHLSERGEAHVPLG